MARQLSALPAAELPDEPLPMEFEIVGGCPKCVHDREFIFGMDGQVRGVVIFVTSPCEEHSPREVFRFDPAQQPNFHSYSR